MNVKEKISDKIFSLVRVYHENGQITDIRNLDEKTELYGRKGILSSFNLVTLIVDIEEFVQDEFGETITIADDRAFSERNSPFSTISSLAAYTEKLMHNK